MFTNNLKFCREEIGLTQAELGKVLGVARQTVTGWETGIDSIPLKRLVKFCELYDFSLDFAMGLSRSNTKYENKIDLSKDNIKKRLKEFRNSIGISQYKLAEDCKFPQSSYAVYESGRYLINTTTLYTIAKTYKISMDYLLGRSNDPKIK